MSKGIDELLQMNKKALEAYGRTIGIELDRRESKTHLIKQLEENIMAKKHKKAKSALGHLADAVKDTVSKTASEVTETKNQVLLLNKKTGEFFKGAKPAGDKNGRSGGVPYWEV